MTLPPPLVAAVREAVCPCFGNRGLMDADRPSARPAARTGRWPRREGVTGDYRVRPTPSGVAFHILGDGMRAGPQFVGTSYDEAEARAVAACLNLLPRLAPDAEGA